MAARSAHASRCRNHDLAEFEFIAEDTDAEDAAPVCKPARAMPSGSRGLLRDVRELILAARSRVAQSVDASLTMLYWQVGLRLRREILQGKRARYGEKIVATVATRLEVEFGRGATYIPPAQNFGRTTVATTPSAGLGSNFKRGSKFTLGQTETLSSLNAY